MIINLKAFLKMQYPAWDRTSMACNLRELDPDFNKGHGKRFYAAFDRAIARNDFK